jgi:glycosyltransferase involved in cell wall biosynthesis
LVTVPTFAKCSVSFVIPTHGSPGHVLEAIASVQQQTRPVDEIIVAVDGIEDLTSPVLRRRYPDVIVLPAVGHLGEAGNRNRAIRAVSGDWVFFMDADDLAHRERIAQTLAYVDEHPGCRAVRAPFWLFAEQADGPDSAWGMRRDFVASNVDECHALSEQFAPVNDFGYLDIEGRSHERMLEFNRGAMSTSAIERRLLLEAGLPPEDLRCGVDWTLFVNVARLAEWSLLPTPVGFQRLHAGQDTRSGGATLARGIIDAKRRVWSTERRYHLADYGVEYTLEVKGFVRAQLRTGNWREAWALLCDGLDLLPRWDDRLYLVVPRRLAGADRRPRTKVCTTLL